MSGPRDLDPMALAEVEAEIRRLNRLLLEHTEAFGVAATEAGEAEADWEIAEARSYLDNRNQGTIPEISARVKLACADQLRRKEITKRRERFLMEAGRNVRAQLDALRSINANSRHLASSASGYGS